MTTFLKISLLTTAIFTLGCQAKYDVEGNFSGLSANEEAPNADTPALEYLAGVGSVNDEQEIETTREQVELLCNSRVKKEKVQTVKFASPGITCQWGENGNLDPVNFLFQARIEQRVLLEIPAGAVPCNLELDFPDQDFLYDDHFALSLNRTILAASYDFSEILEVEPNGLLNYDWETIAGTQWETEKETIYCPIVNGQSNVCSFPRSDEEGKIQIGLGREHVLGAVGNGTPLNGQYFQMTTIGDNDAMDCEHTGLEFQALIQYVE